MVQIVGWKRLVAEKPASVERLKVPIRVARFGAADRMFQRRMVRRSQPGTPSSSSCRLNTSSTGRVTKWSIDCCKSGRGTASGRARRAKNSRSSPPSPRLIASEATLCELVASRCRRRPVSQLRRAGISSATSA